MNAQTIDQADHKEAWTALIHESLFQHRHRRHKYSVRPLAGRVGHACYAESDKYEERTYCSDCYGHCARNEAIHDYYYKPAPIFYGDGPRFFGVELEIDGGGESREKARSLLEVCNREGDYCYIKHDGSLEDGLEVVTHPMDLASQLQRMPWGELCRKAAGLGYLSHRSTTCGLLFDGVIEAHNKIHTLGTDSKIIGRIFEMFVQPV